MGGGTNSPGIQMIQYSGAVTEPGFQGLDGWGGGGEGVGKCLPPNLHVHGEALDVLCLY